MKKPLLSCPYEIKKNVNSVKTTQYYGPKKLIGCPFFPIFTNNQCSHTHNVHSTKSKVVSCHFFQMYHYKLSAVMRIFGQKHVNSVETILYYGPKKSTGCPFSSIFHEKITTFMRISVKKRTFSKENTLACPYFVRKTSILSKTLCSHVKFFKIFMKNPLLPCLYVVKKT